jgi:uncharacterized membrane protein
MELGRATTFRKRKRMKTVMALAMMLALATVCGCRSSSPKGGVTTKEQGFAIKVRRFTMGIKQGDVETAKVSLKRSDYFKQDVRLQISVPEGLTVEPNDVLVKASDEPDVELRITAATNAALGKYRIAIRGTPASGQPTSDELTVEVKAR